MAKMGSTLLNNKAFTACYTTIYLAVSRFSNSNSIEKGTDRLPLGKCLTHHIIEVTMEQLKGFSVKTKEKFHHSILDISLVLIW